MQSNSNFEKNTNKKKSKNEPEETLDNKEQKRKNRVKSKRDLFDEMMEFYDPHNKQPL